MGLRHLFLAVEVDLGVAVEHGHVGLAEHAAGKGTGRDGTADVEGGAAHVDQRFDGNQEARQRDGQVQRGQHDEGRERGATAHTGHADGTDGDDADERQQEAARERIDADGGRDHDGQHRRINAGAAVLAHHRAERCGEIGDAFRRAQARRLRLHAHRDGAGRRARREREREHGEDLLHVAARVQAHGRDDQEMHAEHQDQRAVRGHHEADQLQDVLHAGAGQYLRDQGEHAERRQAQHERHHAHHYDVGDVDELAELLEHVRLLGGDAGRRDANKNGKQHDGDRRRLARTRHVEEGIFRNERQDHCRQRHVLCRRQLAFQIVATRDFGRARRQADGGQAVQLGHQDADRRRDGRRDHQRADRQRTDLAERRRVAQLQDGLDDRHHDQRHDDHLQQFHVARADDVEVGIRLRDDGRTVAVERLERGAEDDAQAEAREHTLGEGQVALLH
ncbi:conserved hypothetical protein, partial [Ricinus communis]